MGTAVGIVYLVGWLGSVGVQRHRAGLSQRGRLGLGMILMSLPWFVISIAKLWVWPIVLVVWLVQGRPPSPWECDLSYGGSLRVRRVETRSLIA